MSEVSPLWKKMNLKDHGTVVVLDAPESFEPELKKTGRAKVVGDLSKLKRVDFAVAFVVTQAELDRRRRRLGRRRRGMPCCGSRIRRGRRSGTRASSIGIAGGGSWKERDSIL